MQEIRLFWRRAQGPIITHISDQLTPPAGNITERGWQTMIFDLTGFRQRPAAWPNLKSKNAALCIRHIKGRRLEWPESRPVDDHTSGCHDTQSSTSVISHALEATAWQI
jgi:hypothetical protein